MPRRYLAEMVMDRIAASKVYRGKQYTDGSPLEYFLMSQEGPLMHQQTARQLTMPPHYAPGSGGNGHIPFYPGDGAPGERTSEEWI